MRKFINERTISRSFFKCCLVAMLLCVGTSSSYAQNTSTGGNDEARVTGLSHVCVHILQLEKSLKLYREILGFKLVDADVFKGVGLEGMLALQLRAGDVSMTLSLTAPEYISQLAPIGNTNHNHFTLIVNDITTIGDKLKAEGYELEHDNYATSKYTFFTGPNGEIIGLRED